MAPRKKPSPKPETKAALAALAATASKALKPGEDMIVRVTGPKKGRWRSGPTLAARNYGPQPIDLPAAELSEDDIAALRADPTLTVELIKAVGDDAAET